MSKYIKLVAEAVKGKMRTFKKGDPEYHVHGTNGDYVFARHKKDDISYVFYKGKQIDSGDFDRGADGWFMNHSKFGKAQKFFSDKDDLLNAYAKAKITESSMVKVDIEGLPTIYVDEPSATRVKTNLRKLLKRSDSIKDVKRVPAGVMRKDFRNRLSGKEEMNEVLTKKDPIEKWIKDFVESDNPKFKGKSKEERIEMAKGAYYGAQKESLNVYADKINNSLNESLMNVWKAIKSQADAKALVSKLTPIQLKFLAQNKKSNAKFAKLVDIEMATRGVYEAFRKSGRKTWKGPKIGLNTTKKKDYATKLSYTLAAQAEQVIADTVGIKADIMSVRDIIERKLLKDGISFPEDRDDVKSMKTSTVDFTKTSVNWKMRDQKIGTVQMSFIVLGESELENTEYNTIDKLNGTYIHTIGFSIYNGKIQVPLFDVEWKNNK